jgi:hypothetical protein
MDLETGSAAFIAHPGHEILFFDWLRRTQPCVFVLTDGSGAGSKSRLYQTEQLLTAASACRGGIFGRLSDAQAYALIMEQQFEALCALAEELAAELIDRQLSAVVCDAAEGHNPVHDLSNLIVGTACALAKQMGAVIEHYEYSIVRGPAFFCGNGTFVHQLDEAALERKLAAAQDYSQLREDMTTGLAWFGRKAFQREAFHLVEDWTAPTFDLDQVPYEIVGAERIKQGRYTKVIRYREHMLPLQRATIAWLRAQQPAPAMQARPGRHLNM